jgi:hypothetical protein
MEFERAWPPPEALMMASAYFRVKASYAKGSSFDKRVGRYSATVG